jgi:hypothetical protein
MTGEGLMLTAWCLHNGWYEAVALAAIIGSLTFVARRRRALATRDAGLRARADFEYRLSLAGDPRGLFGRYPPVQPGWFPTRKTVLRCVISTARYGRPMPGRGRTRSDLRAIMRRIVALVERRQIACRGVHQRRVGRDAPRCTIPAGACSWMHPRSLRQQ